LFLLKRIVGLVPEATQEGDLICIFFGFKTPFLVQRAFVPFEGEYCPVGGCYVHSIMKGEAIDRLEKGRKIIWDFVLSGSTSKACLLVAI
jgi:hypothetical protein